MAVRANDPLQKLYLVMDVSARGAQITGFPFLERAKTGIKREREADGNAGISSSFHPSFVTPSLYSLTWSSP